MVSSEHHPKTTETGRMSNLLSSLQVTASHYSITLPPALMAFGRPQNEADEPD